MKSHRLLALAVMLNGGLHLAACAPARTSVGEAEPERAAPVPVLVLTEAQADTPQVAEAGDRIEVRLPEGKGLGSWQLAQSQGENVTLEEERAEGEARVFHFTTRAAGRARLDFRRGDRVLTFTIEVR